MEPLNNMELINNILNGILNGKPVVVFSVSAVLFFIVATVFLVFQLYSQQKSIKLLAFDKGFDLINKKDALELLDQIGYKYPEGYKIHIDCAFIKKVTEEQSFFIANLCYIPKPGVPNVNIYYENICLFTKVHCESSNGEALEYLIERYNPKKDHSNIADLNNFPKIWSWDEEDAHLLDLENQFLYNKGEDLKLVLTSTTKDLLLSSIKDGELDVALNTVDKGEMQKFELSKCYLCVKNKGYFEEKYFENQLIDAQLVFDSCLA